MPGLNVVLLSEETLRADSHPELNVMLVLEGIVPDPTGRRPPERLEVRLSPKALTDLGAQIRAVQRAQLVQARARAEREMQGTLGPEQMEQDERERAAEVAADTSRVDTGVLERMVVALHERGDTAPDTAA